MNKKKHAQVVFTLLDKEYPDVETALRNWKDDWQFVMCVVMSARTTDKQVNEVTKTLFKKFPTLESFANASQKDMEKAIGSIGFYKNKAKFLRELAKMLIEDYKGKVPMDIDEMQKLSGVGRKTANVVIGVLSDNNQGVAVDTHVMRLSQRLGFTKHKTPEKIEPDLMKLFARKDWDNITLLLIEHGRQICKARNPNCEGCFLNKICPSAFKF